MTEQAVSHSLDRSWELLAREPSLLSITPCIDRYVLAFGDFKLDGVIAPMLSKEHGEAQRFVASEKRDIYTWERCVVLHGASIFASSTPASRRCG